MVFCGMFMLYTKNTTYQVSYRSVGNSVYIKSRSNLNIICMQQFINKIVKIIFYISSSLKQYSPTINYIE